MRFGTIDKRKRRESLKRQTIEVECSACGGTGIYRGFAEPEGVGVVCLNCNGTGKTTLTYTPFTGRKLKKDIKIVRHSGGAFVGPTGESVTYEEFLNGKMPR